MALSPLQVEIFRTASLTIAGTTFDVSVPVVGATLEVRHKLRPEMSADYYSDDGAVISGVTTDATGAAEVWETNGNYEWRVAGTYTTAWKAFRAYAGQGAEYVVSTSTSQALPVVSSLVTPSFGVENTIGAVELTLTFDHEHMADVIIMLLPPWAAALGRAQFGFPSLESPAMSGGSPLVGAAVEVRNAVTLAPVDVYATASGGSPITPVTDAFGSLAAWVESAILQWRVPTSDNFANWGPLVVITSLSVILWDGPSNVALNGLSDFAFDGTVKFTHKGGQYDGVAFADGDTILNSTLQGAFQGHPADGTWDLWIAGGVPGTPGELAVETLELVAV